MLDSIFQFFDSLGWIGWSGMTLLVITLGAWAAGADDDNKTEDFLEVSEEYPAQGIDTVTCSVPGQPIIILGPNDFHDYNEAYTGIWAVTLKNGNSIFLPMQYTTIIDKSFKSTNQTTNG